MDWGYIIGSCGTVAAIVFGYVGIRRESRKQEKSLGEQMGTIAADIGYVKAGINELKSKQDKQDDRMSAIGERVALVEGRQVRASQDR